MESKGLLNSMIKFLSLWRFLIDEMYNIVLFIRTLISPGSGPGQPLTHHPESFIENQSFMLWSKYKSWYLLSFHLISSCDYDGDLEEVLPTIWKISKASYFHDLDVMTIGMTGNRFLFISLSQLRSWTMTQDGDFGFQHKVKESNNFILK